MNYNCIYALCLSLSLLFVSTLANAQGESCIDATPFCIDVPITYPASFGGGVSAPVGPNYGCLGSEPNPAWFYLQVDNPGPINLAIQRSPPRDLDFAIWGPFAPGTDLSTACTQILSGTIPPNDCSYAGTTLIETPSINPTLTGQIYILMVTNFSNAQTDLNLTQTSGTGTTSCAILCGVDAVADVTTSAEGCAGITLTADVANFTTGWTYQWYKNDELIPEATNQNYVVPTPSVPTDVTDTYRVEATNLGLTCADQDTVDVSMTNVAVPTNYYYRDMDGDGFGDPAMSLIACSPPMGYVADNTDCNDSSAAINPAATEICDGIDNNCNNLVDTADPAYFDNTLPTISCVGQVSFSFNGETSIQLGGMGSPIDLEINANDNCGIDAITYTPSAINSSQMGQTVPVVIKVTDGKNNMASCTSSVIVASLPSGWSQNPDGIGCNDDNNLDYNPVTETWTVTSANCFYSAPFTSDAISFGQRTLCGNGSITAQVTGISGTSLGWAGVTMRESNAPGAKKAQLTTNMSNFSRREFRTNTNGAAFPQQFPSQNRRWLRIVRSGNQFVMYVSPNGVNWAFAGAQNIQMNSCIEIGLVVTNYSSNSTLSATFANVNVTGGNQSLSGGDLASLAYQDDQSDFRDVKIYPNPTSGELNISLSGYESRPVTLEVFNTMGQILYIKEIDEVQNADENIDLSSVASGMYLIRVSSDGLPAEMKRVTVTR